jgi:hypothetical protein
MQAPGRRHAFAACRAVRRIAGTDVFYCCWRALRAGAGRRGSTTIWWHRKTPRQRPSVEAAGLPTYSARSATLGLPLAPHWIGGAPRGSGCFVKPVASGRRRRGRVAGRAIGFGSAFRWPGRRRGGVSRSGRGLW